MVDNRTLNELTELFCDEVVEDQLDDNIDDLSGYTTLGKYLILL